MCIRDRMTEKWGNDIKDSLTEAKQVEKTTIEAVAQAKGKIPQESYKKAMKMLNEGQENLRVVAAGGGVHNKKYAQLLVDTALTSFENAMSELKANDQKGGKNEH
jgi:glyoxylate carboligase